MTVPRPVLAGRNDDERMELHARDRRNDRGTRFLRQGAAEIGGVGVWSGRSCASVFQEMDGWVRNVFGCELGLLEVGIMCQCVGGKSQLESEPVCRSTDGSFSL